MEVDTNGENEHIKQRNRNQGLKAIISASPIALALSSLLATPAASQDVVDPSSCISATLEMDSVFKTRMQSFCLQIVLDVCEGRKTLAEAEECVQETTQKMRADTLVIRGRLPDEISGQTVLRRLYASGLERLDEDLARTECLRFGEEYQTFCSFQRGGLLIFEAYRLAQMSNSLELD